MWSITALDKTAPATLSRKVISTVIRKQIGFRGLLMTDDLSMKALVRKLCREDAQRRWTRAATSSSTATARWTEMEEVAEAAGVLKGKALARARAALKIRPQAPALRPEAGPQGPRKSRSPGETGDKLWHEGESPTIPWYQGGDATRMIDA